MFNISYWHNENQTNTDIYENYGISHGLKSLQIVQRMVSETTKAEFGDKSGESRETIVLNVALASETVIEGRRAQES